MEQQNRTGELEMNIFEISGNDLENIVSNFGMAKFRFLTVPSRGDFLQLTVDWMREIYRVEQVVHEGRGPDSSRAEGSPSVTLYVSHIRTMRELV